MAVAIKRKVKKRDRRLNHGSARSSSIRTNSIKYRIDMQTISAAYRDVWGERGINQPYSGGM